MVQKRLGEFRELFHSPKYIFMLLGTATLLGANWFVYIYGVNTNQVIETSLGYFISPLLVILLGAVFLRERLNIWQVSCGGFCCFRSLEFYMEFWFTTMDCTFFSIHLFILRIIP